MENISFTKSLFFGNILEDMVFPYPELPTDSVDTLKAVIDATEKFAASVDGAKIEEMGSVPIELIKQMGDLGLLGLAVPEDLGGIGLNQTSYGRMIEEISKIDGSVALTAGAHQSIGYKALLLGGTDAQKKKYLPKLASGEWLAAFALTEPGAGSDAGSIQTKAVKQPDGSFRLSGQKLWITNGGIADFYTVFAKQVSEDEANGKITAFFVERKWDGISTGQPEKKLGIKASNTVAVFFDNVLVPKENLCGEEGKGFKVAMNVLNNGRMGLGAGSVGACKKLISYAIKHANERKQFGRPLNSFGLIKEKISQMVVDTFAAESAVYLATGMVDRKVLDTSMESAICKIFATETLWRVVNEALQTAGGQGYMAEYPYERLLRDSRINMIFEGTNEILRMFVGLSGLQGPGEFLSGVGRALNNPIKGFGVLSEYAVKKIKTSITGDIISKAHPALRRETTMIEEYVMEFATASEKVIRKHGKEIVEMQFATKRICDICIDLYVAIATISRVTKMIEKYGEAKCEIPIGLARLFCAQANRRIRGNFKLMEKNEDELAKDIAMKVSELGRYPFGILGEFI